MAYTQSLLAISDQPTSTASSPGASSGGAEDPDSRTRLGQAPRQDQASKAESLEEKRVSNAKMKRELLPELRYPSYREGMKAMVEGNIAPFTWEDLESLGLTTD